MPEPSAVSAEQEAGAQAPSEPSPLETTTAERDKLREQLLRTAADFDNFRKRSRRDVDDAKQRGKDDVIRELLPVFDNLERAVQTADSASDIRSVLDGVRMVLKLFEDTSERMGLERVPTVGERFDPAIHEALQQIETDAHPAGSIMTEVEPGYRFGQRLVRPAKVVVARKPPEAAASDAAKASMRPEGASQRPTAEAQASTSGETSKTERNSEKTE